MFAISLVTVVVVLAEAAVLLVGLRSAAMRAGRQPGRLVARVGTGIALWLGFLALLSLTGVLSNFEARPPRMMIVLASSLLVFGYTTTRPWFGEVLRAMPCTWPIGIHTFRIVIELGLYALYTENRLPVHLTFEGRNFDVLVGLSAPLVALALARRVIGSRAAIVWNVAGLVLLANIVGMATTTMPGPLHLSWPGPDNVLVAEFPYVWLPGFLVPVALFGHIASLRQLLGVRQTSRGPGSSAAADSYRGPSATEPPARSSTA